jgi:hypothetical protein
LAARAKRNEESDISLSSVLADITKACDMAEASGAANVVLNAAGLRAKLGGLLVDKVEHGAPGDFDGCETIEQVTAKFVDDMADPDKAIALLDEIREAVLAHLASRAKVIEPPRVTVDREAERRYALDAVRPRRPR